MASILAPLPPQWRQSVTFDNGTEFARHHQLHALGIQTFFCDVRSPWQKGGVENAIGRMRRFLPRKTDLAALTQERFCQLVQAYNNTPRKCLGLIPPLKFSPAKCCTSNVNPHSCLRIPKYNLKTLIERLWVDALSFCDCYNTWADIDLTQEIARQTGPNATGPTPGKAGCRMKPS